MRNVVVLGVVMTNFGKFLERSLKDLSGEAVRETLEHAGIDKKAIQAAYVSNSMAGLMTGQESIRGQVWLRPMGIEGIPIFNVESPVPAPPPPFTWGGCRWPPGYTTACWPWAPKSSMTRIK